MVRILNCGPYTVDLFAAGNSQTVVYAVMDQADAQAVWSLLKEPKPTLAAISGVDWNRELSPWPAPGVFRDGGNFGGDGPTFLDMLTGQIVPLAEAQLGFVPVSRAVTGYSLAGLFALWVVFQTDVFDRAASVSGSLWYDGFMDYIRSSAPPSGLRRIYLSLGDREKNARNQRMAAVEDCTRRAAELLREWDIPVFFEMNPGGHFQCSRLSPQQQAEQMTLNRLSELPMRYLSNSEVKWLKNRTSDHRPAVRELAREVYTERFPYAARNRRKQQLSIKVLELVVDSEVYDLCGDPTHVNENYRVTRTPPAIVRTQEDGSVQTVAPQPKELSKLLKWTVHTLEIFCWEQDFCDPFDIELDEPEPVTWRIHVEYSNGEIQDTESTNGIPDRLDELLFSLSEFFEQADLL